jgi:hypothetical protein
MTLLARCRLTPSAKKRVHHATQMQKVAQPSNAGRDSGIGGYLHAAAQIGPGCRNVQATAVRQLHTQLQHIRPLLSADHSQDLPFMGMPLTGDRHTNRKAMKRGSLT